MYLEAPIKIHREVTAVPAMRQNRCIPVSGAVRRGHDDFLVALPAARYIVISSDF